MEFTGGRLRFPKEARLLSRADFQRVFDQAVKSGDQCFTILARSNQLNFPRLGLAISKKAIRSAVHRNRVKRIVRESFRLHQNELGAMDIVVLARNGLSDRENPEIHASLEKHWQRLVKKCATS